MAYSSDPAIFKQQVAALDPATQAAVGRWLRAASGLPPEPIAPPDLDPTEAAAYGARTSQVNTNYQTQLAQNQFNRAGAVAGFRNQQEDLSRGFNKQRQALPYSYNARGLARSGIYKQGLGDFADNQLRTMNRFLQSQQQTLGGYDVEAQGLGQQRTAGLADIEAQKQARRQQLAVQIRGMQ